MYKLKYLDYTALINNFMPAPWLQYYNQLKFVGFYFDITHKLLSFYLKIMKL